MTFRTNRLYCLLSRSYLKQLILPGCILILFVILIFQDPTISPAKLLAAIPFFLLINLILILGQPKDVSLENDRLLCKAWLQKNRSYGGMVRIKGGNSYKQVNLFIRRITKIEVAYLGYHKAQRVASFRLYGEIHAKDRYDNFAEDVIIPPYIDLHGILDAEAALTALQQAFPSAELTETGRRAK